METKTLFKKGQTVYDSALFGDLKGKVIDDSNGSIYPIIVEFGDERFAYTYDGRLIESANPTLTDQLYKVEYVPPQPQIDLPEVGQWYWFWDDNVPFFIYGKFDYYCAGTKFPYKVQGWGAYQNFSTTYPIEK